MDKIKFSVVIPCYNEEQNVVPLYNELKEVFSNFEDNYEIIFIDDCSSDNTFSLLEQLHDKDKRVKVLRFKRNFGQTAAIKAGFDVARGKYIVTMDCDLQNDPRDIPRLFDELIKKNYDVVCGWRFNRKDSISKRIFSKFANWMRRKFTQENVHDSGCTLRIYKNECIKNLELFGELHRYIPAILHWRGYKIGEIKVNHRPRKFGKTKYSWKRLVKGLLDLIVVAFWQKYALRPTYVFGGFGLITMVLGVLIFLYLVIMRIFFHGGLSDRPLFTVSIFMVIVGVQFITIGLLTDILVRIYFKQGEQEPYLIDIMLK